MTESIVVTVTYGKREHLLRQVLDGVRNSDVSMVVVVDNGAAWPVKAGLTVAYPDFVHVVEMVENTGSAMGYSTGIQRALELGAEYIWLLDDDNRPRSDALQKLFEVYNSELMNTPRDQLAVLAFRPEHQADVAMGVATHRINPRANSFRGFHVLDIPYKIWRRTRWGRPQACGILPATIALDTAPYSGLLFHRGLIQSIGLPNHDFVLYADDNEFTYRIVTNGGRILLVTAALIDDLESSWNVKKRFSNGFLGNLKGAGDFRAYYGMRNGVYVDTLYIKKNGFVFWVNRYVYMSLLFLFSVMLRKTERYRLLRDAVDDGLSGKLGLNKKYQL
ncbi:glycosyltransferase [Acidithiobacillus sp. HP-6]|uniref:glycosyltransferase n=1 Tax=unclassified Acidithiobacillus TaxID=2614800 RepID=UPI0018793BF7|nr:MULTISPECIES: glycosyltransferase [unclassified Acidithiobacillus]MBE7561652.1 glycosyltransferase [Acidithiobacillus sp. HP-6]MBE7568434.1 glycosyltransferase [Acidithiobacillus sp. HP-2]